MMQKYFLKCLLVECHLMMQIEIESLLVKCHIIVMQIYFCWLNAIL